MAETASGKRDQESWRNESPGTVFIKRLDHRGELSLLAQIDSGKVFHLTPEERRINMEQAADPQSCLFRNGTLTPVRLLDNSDEAREIASNPNTMSERDMRALMKAAPQAFAGKLAEITNPLALQRMMAIARDEDVALSRAEAINRRLHEVMPGTGPVDRGPATTSNADARIAADEMGRAARTDRRPRAVTPQ